MAFLAALGHISNVGQLFGLAQNQVQQGENIRWNRRNWKLDGQALRTDLLCTARDDTRHTYDTYSKQIDTLMELTTFVLPFALSIVQLSDQYTPQTADSCYDNGVEPCVEVDHPWLIILWIYIYGVTLILPFWGLLMLLRCKIRLDSWLQYTVDDLHELRLEILGEVRNRTAGSDVKISIPTDAKIEEQEQVITRVGDFIVASQDRFVDTWDAHCAPLVYWATRLLWASVTMAVGMTSFLFWLFLANRHGQQHPLHAHAAVGLSAGLLAPIVVVCFQSRLDNIIPPRMPQLQLPGAHVVSDASSTSCSSPGNPASPLQRRSVTHVRDLEVPRFHRQDQGGKGN